MENCKKSAITLSLCIVVALSNYLIAQPQHTTKSYRLHYDDYRVEPENLRMKERIVWRYILLKEKPITPKVDTIYGYDTIRNKENDIVRIVRNMSVRYTHNGVYFEYPDTVLYSKERFNERGLCIYEEGFSNGVDAPQYDSGYYTYDRKNRIIHFRRMEKDTSYSSTDRNIFNDLAMTIRQERWDRYSLRKYDKYGRKIYDESYDKDGHMLGKTMYEYSDKGRLIFERYGGYGEYSTTEYVRYKLDNKRRVVENVRYNEDSTFASGEYTEYDKHGRIVQQKWVHDKNRDIWRNYRYEYDKKGKLQVMNDLNSDGIITGKKRFFYRKDGLLDYTIWYNKKGEPVVRYQYSYTFR